jgi:hypothetical protein
MNRLAALDLDTLRIATPCPADWNAMKGDARKRFCGQCRLHVYDVSELTRREAETLIRTSEGRVCLRLHRRADGRVVTKDCGRVRLALERRLNWIRSAAAALLAAVGLAGCQRGGSATPEPAPTGGVTPSAPTMGDVADPGPVPTLGNIAVPTMGEPGPTMGGVTASTPPPEITTGRVRVPPPDGAPTPAPVK